MPTRRSLIPLMMMVLVGCEAPPPEASSMESSTAKAPPADPASVTASSPSGLLDAHVPAQLQTVTFALG